MSTTAPDAELAVIGALVQQPDLAIAVMERLAVADFIQYEKPAAVLWNLLGDTAPVDPVTYRTALLERQALPREKCGSFVHAAVQAAWMPASVGAYADAVLRASRRRKLARVAATVTRGIEQSVDVDDLCLSTMDSVEKILAEQVVDDVPSMSLRELMDTPIEYDWIVPGLLERTDRFVLSAAEGSGKSTFVRMLALCAACGLHPFTKERIEPVRVLMVDCENSRKQSARKFRQMAGTLADMGFDAGDMLAYQSRPEGLDLAQPQDAAWLLNRVQVDRPQLLTIGPAYRLCSAISDDDAVLRVLTALDAARLRAGCALVLEAHPGQGQQWSKERDLRPKGSQLWRAWPESIRGLRRDEQDSSLARLEFAGRGDRDERYWPSSLREGYPDELPWVALTPDDEDIRKQFRRAS